MRAAAVLVALACLVGGCSDDDSGDPSTVGAGDPDIEGVEVVLYEETGYLHRQGDLTYANTPPAGGLHNDPAVRCGFYDEPVRDEWMVHSLEHGAVWLAYAPDLAADDVETIHDVVRAHDDTVASPYPGLDEGVAVVVTAWTRQLTLDSVDDPRLEQFIDRYLDGDQSPEASVPCTGVGEGEPIP
jgi:hypothetical protein